MKKIMLVFSVLSILCGCSQQPSIDETVENKKLNIYTSFYCIYDFTQKIVGDKADVTNLITAGTEPHDWEPTANDMASLQNCDVLLCNGLDMEGWLEDVKASVDVNAVILTDNIDVDNTEISDPHIWLNPMLAEKMAFEICNTVSSLDSENAEYYAQNYKQLSKQLKELNEQYANTLAPYSGKKIVVSHKAYGYLCDAYNLEQIAIDGLFADSEPSPSQMKSIIDTIKADKINAIFYEELLSQKTADTIANETGADLLPLNPLEGLTQTQIDNGEDYLSIMRENLENLERALVG